MSMLHRRVVVRALVVCGLALGALWAVPAALAAEKGPIPDGVYTLMKISGGDLINLGTLEIRQQTYRTGDDKEFAPFTIDAKGGITWSKGLSFLPNGWKHESSSYAGPDNKGRPLIKIHYKSARGTLDLIDALKEK